MRNNLNWSEPVGIAIRIIVLDNRNTENLHMPCILWRYKIWHTTIYYCTFIVSVFSNILYKHVNTEHSYPAAAHLVSEDLSRGNISWSFWDNFPNFSMKIMLWVFIRSTSVMSTHNVCCYGEIIKLSQNYHHFSFTITLLYVVTASYTCTVPAL